MTPSPQTADRASCFLASKLETWSFDEDADAWFFHRFYDFQPDLNWSNPDVRAEINKVMGFWLQLGASGFRIDAAPFVLEQVRPGIDPAPKDFSILDDWRQEVQWRLGDVVLLCEANVPADDLPKYCVAVPEGPNDRAHMLFAFLLNIRLWLGLARHDSEPIVEALQAQPRLPAMAQWATFLRNHDELDLSQLTAEQRDDVFKAFAPVHEMRIYDRGIRRRLAPMLKGDRRRMELAYALQFAVPGSPVLRYGEEIGMGENLDLPGRHAIRTPMQWDDGPVGGFSTSGGVGLAPTASVRGRYGARRANVQAQIGDPKSLLRWFQQLIATLRECPEIGNGQCTIVEAALPRPVLAHRMDAPEGSILLLHNLGPDPLTINIGKLDGMSGRPFDVLADTPYPRPTKRLTNLELHAWGYRWIRLRRTTEA